MAQGIVLFSGGLDSMIAVHLLKSQGLDILAVHFVLPFYSRLGIVHKEVQKYADALNTPLLIVEEGDEYLGMIKDPYFGYGKNANPCIDCRIHRLQKAKKIMESVGASFMATGEVIGQRPMSQRLDALNVIENRAGVKGVLIRPLCAKLLPPTIPEQNGLVDRTRLMEIQGRSRKVQLEYARTHKLTHAQPAGGCSLTNESTANRYLELQELNPDFSLTDFKLLAYGRHIRLSPKCKLIVSRDDSENRILARLASPEDHVIELRDIPGPIGIVKWCDNEQLLEKAGGLLSRYSRARDQKDVPMFALHKGNKTFFTCQPIVVENSEFVLVK